jgi:DNA-binding NarL/FixJ family response regulator
VRGGAWSPELTEREQEISGELFHSNKTVQNHVSNIFRRLQVADRAQATLRAREAGLGEDRTLP